MTHIILWFNLAAFTLMFAGFGFELVNWLRRRDGWRVLYLWYIALYASWLLFQTFLFFNLYYLDEPIGGLNSFTIYLRGILSVGIIIVYPLYIIKAAGLSPGRGLFFLLSLPPAASVIGITASLLGGSNTISVVMNLFYNLYMLVLSMAGIFRLRSNKASLPRNEVLRFLYLSSGLYIMLLVFGTVFAIGFLQTRRPLISVVIGGVFCLSWAVLLITSGLQRAASGGRELNGLPESFITSFAISSRESDVAVLLISGAANREIAEKLFISTRTVEAHIYNLYRKCGCRNKVEFINKIQGYKNID